MVVVIVPSAAVTVVVVFPEASVDDSTESTSPTTVAPAPSEGCLQATKAKLIIITKENLLKFFITLPHLFTIYFQL